MKLYYKCLKRHGKQKKIQNNRGQKQQINLIELKVGSYKVYTYA